MQTAQVRAGSGAVVTTTSGATVAQPVATGKSATIRPPIVTRASGAGAGGIQIDD